MDKGKLIESIVCMLVLGEVFGNVVSRPLAALGTLVPKKIYRIDNTNVEKMATLIDVMNQRICDLEDKLKETEA